MIRYFNRPVRKTGREERVLKEKWTKFAIGACDEHGVVTGIVVPESPPAKVFTVR